MSVLVKAKASVKYYQGTFQHNEHQLHCSTTKTTRRLHSPVALIA